MFPNVGDVITTLTKQNAGVYTASQDCFVCGRIYGNGSDKGSAVFCGSSSSNNTLRVAQCMPDTQGAFGIYLKKGDSIYLALHGTAEISVLGLH